MPQPNCQSIRYCWEANKVKTLIRLRAELSPLFTGKRNASKYAWAILERELNVPLPISKIIKKWNNLLQEYKAIKLSEEPKRREWPFFTLMDVYFSDQVNDPSLRLFSSTKRFDTDTFDDKNFDEELQAALAAANVNASMSSVLSNLGLGLGLGRNRLNSTSSANNQNNFEAIEDNHSSSIKIDDEDDNKSEISLNLSSNNDKNNNKSHHNLSINNLKDKDDIIEPNNNVLTSNNKNLINNNSSSFNANSENSLNSSINNVTNNNNDDDYEDNMARAYEHNLKNLNQKFLDEMNEHHNIDQYLLSWRGFHGNMCKGFHNLQRDGQMVDVTIAAGGKIFKAHKLVLSVCSPYFQKIFLEHPSTHPILFMTDVSSTHMAGLLDFMYSGQVNVKYEDLPNFLKVAEALQVKGLHGESTAENEEKEREREARDREREREREREENSYVSQYRQQQQQQLHQQQQYNYQSHIRQSSTPTFQYPENVINENRNIRHHIKPKTSLINSNNNDLANSNNNNNNNTNNNNANLANNNHKSPKFGVQQINSSNKMLDNQKYQKYYSKRKILAQYEQELRQEKRNRTMEQGPEDYDENSRDSRPLNMRKSPIETNEERDNNDNCVGLNLIQNIKTEKSADDDHNETTNGDDCSSTGNETGGYYGTHLGKIRHSILEPNIVLNHGDDVLPTTTSSPGATPNPSSIISQKTTS